MPLHKTRVLQGGSCALNYRTCAQKQASWNSPGNPGYPPDPGFPADPPDPVSGAAARTLPSTRAGGQDDVSLNKLPQITLPTNECPAPI